MTDVVTARRSLLPLPALVVLAGRCDVPLPPGWAPEAPVTDAEAAQAGGLLVEAGLVSEAGEPADGVREALAPLRTPLATVDVLLAPAKQRPPVPADQPAEAFAGVVVLGEHGLVGLLRRDGVPLVELTVAGRDALRPSVERLLASVPAQPAEATVAERLDLAAFTALSGFDGRFDAEQFAASYDADPERVAAVARLLDTTTHALRVVVVGDRRAAAPPAGLVLLYRSAPGWLDVTPEDGDVVLRSAEPTDALPTVLAYVAGAL